MVLKYIIYYLEKNFCKLFHFFGFQIGGEMKEEETAGLSWPVTGPKVANM
jgi:hypothetical protein